jgi:hypothetical protein
MNYADADFARPTAAGGPQSRGRAIGQRLKSLISRNAGNQYSEAAT